MYKKVELSEDEKDEYDAIFHQKVRTPGLYRVEPNTFYVGGNFELETIRNFEIYDDDLFIVTPPKSGTTWMQEIVWLLKNEIDIETSKRLNQFYRIPFLELSSVLSRTGNEKYPDHYPDSDVEMSHENAMWFMSHSIEYARKMARPRIIKTHLPFWLLPENLLKKAKVIFVAREPKDQAVSWFYHHKLTAPNLDFNQFALRMKEKKPIVFTPIMPMIVDAWKRYQNDSKNLFFTTYERMKESLDEVLDQLCSFLDIKHDQSKLDELKNAVTVSAFRKNP